MQKAMCFHDFAIVCVQGSDSRINFWYMGRNDAINMQLKSKMWIIMIFSIICKNV